MVVLNLFNVCKKNHFNQRLNIIFSHKDHVNKVDENRSTLSAEKKEGAKRADVSSLLKYLI